MNRLYRVLIILDTEGTPNTEVTDIFESGASAEGVTIAEIGFVKDVVKTDLAFAIDVT